MHVCEDISGLAHTTFDAALDMFGFLGCKDTWLGHVHSPIDTPKFFSEELLSICSSSSLRQILGVSPTQVKHVGPFKLHEIPMGHFQACPGPSGGHSVLQECQSHHSAWCHANLLRAHSIPLLMLLMEILTPVPIQIPEGHLLSLVLIMTLSH